MLEFDEPSHTYRWNGKIVPGVTQVIRAALGDPFSGVPPDVLERKRAIGSAAHKACELDSQGRLDEATVHPAVLPYLRAWRAFVSETAFWPTWREEKVYNAAHGYAGQLDFLGGCAANNTSMLVDMKTGLPGPLAALQTSAYAEAACSERPSMPMPRRFSLQVLTTGRYKLVEYSNPGDFADFLACLRIYRLKERIAA